MASLEKAVKWAEMIAADDTHGYDQAHRNDPDYDCSSLVGTALNQAGFPVSKYSTTRNLYEQLKEAGFSACTPPYKRGDIHLTPGHHVVMSISPDKIVHASQNEFGGATGGKTGDQTGKEICTRSFYTPSYGWTYHLRYKAEQAVSQPKEIRARYGAQSFDKAKAGVYRTTDRLNLRDGGSTSRDVLTTLPKGTEIRCYGYYTGSFLYVSAVIGSTTYIGFCSKSYLVKE